MPSWKYTTIGAAVLAVAVLVVALAVAQYNRAFDSIVPITINADRSGLLMDPGAAVKLSGVRVGSVSAVTTDGNGARLSVDLDPAQIGHIPAALSANLVPTTVFGAKYVELRRAAPTPGHVTAGAVIDRANVTVELDNTFDAVLKTLQAVSPAQLNSALTAVADALRGRGAEAGQVIGQLDDYLRKLNPSLPQLSQRLPQITAVAGDYRDIVDPLADTLANLGATATTLVQQRQQFAAFLTSLRTAGDATSQFLERDGDGLVTTLDTLRPTARLLARYSPVLPCFLGGVVYNTQFLRAIMGGPELGGIHQNVQVTISGLPGTTPYKYPQDLPKTGVDTGPDCHGLPVVNGIPPYVHYDTGADPYPGHDETTTLNPQPLALYLFGPLSPVGGGR
ncbi:MCE family protein [Amycolatopsis sp. K13G38]|uniref:MCE family protein n=1 Tax=Amycolatopsis acididurans TaxID=2724524 RepID=A0ABX1IZX6_9PSEU|nr:MCE family protein [Amycolatopsis acididurans]NKQ51670.1 MCE family protein [Amycolatopsis acididurans]